MSYRDEIHEMRSELKALYKAIPGATRGFAELSKAAGEDGVLERKHREYVAIGIAVAQRCQPCINFHVEALMKAGGTRQELSDVLAMALQMGGGPALMYAGHALACWDELAAATQGA
jgi:AhpD family alkylhydroperoxidase